MDAQEDQLSGLSWVLLSKQGLWLPAGMSDTLETEV